MKKSLDRCIMRSFSSLPLAVRPRLIAYNKNSIPTDGGESKSVRPKGDTQRKPKKIASGEVSAGQKEVSARTSESPTLWGRGSVNLNDEDISRICDYLCLDFGDFKIRHKHEDNRYFVIIPKKRNVKVPENQRLGDVAIDPGVRTFGVDVDRDYNGARGIYLRALSAMTPPKAGNC